MFTGIVRHVGAVRGVRNAAGGRKITVDLGPLTAGLARGDSVCVAGVCLTVTAMDGTAAGFDVMAETLAHTTIGSLGAGERVNLERALQLGQGLDGHLVTGHVDGVATVRAVRSGDRCSINFSVPGELTGVMVAKGAVAVDGVSLTLAEVGADGFGVALIPTTLTATTLADLRPGHKVNVETDIIGKYVRKFLPAVSAGGLTPAKLKEAGFIE